ncbi:MAG: hypothetical protein IJU61_14770 [Victivallales bacterium]|nr:hypothetical protein [Victivallales bacterium]
MLDSFFSNKCCAYVDEYGRALTGKALAAAKVNPKVRRCGARVRLRAKVCRECGSPAPNAWWRCGACGKWIGADAESCPHCGHRQNPSARINLDNGVWRKGDDVFAQRFELNDVAAMFNRGLVVEEGQCAILLRDGKVEDVLPPGRYPASDLADLDGYAKSGERKALVMVDMAELAYPAMVSGLRSKDDLDLSLVCRVFVRFDPKYAENFLGNIMSGHGYVDKEEVNASVSYDAVARNLLLVEVETAAQDVCNAHRIDELFKDPALRNELEDRVRNQLKEKLEAAGLGFVRLTEVDFHGGAYERLREMSGDVEKRRRELELQLRLDELATDAEKRKALGADNLDDYLEQLALEKEMKAIVRGDEVARVKEAFDRDRALADLELRFQKAKKEQTDVHELEKIDAQHDEELKKIQKDGELDRRQAEHAELLRQRLVEQDAALKYESVEIEIQKMQQEAALALADKKLDLKDKQNRIDEAHEQARADMLKTLDILTRISLAKTPAEMHYLMKAYQAQLRSGMDPMKLLADAAAQGNAAAGEALRNMSADKIALLEEWRRSDKETAKENMDRLERMHEKSVEALSKASSNNTTQIIK